METNKAITDIIRLKKFVMAYIFTVSLLLFAILSVLLTINKSSTDINMQIATMGAKIDSPLLNLDLVPMGIMKVSMYTQHEPGVNYTTASLYRLDPFRDSGRICAISRDLWKKDILPGDVIWIKELNFFLVALDTMAIYHPEDKDEDGNKVKQLRWIDIYESDQEKVDSFGLKFLTIYKLRR